MSVPPPESKNNLQPPSPTKGADDNRSGHSSFKKRTEGMVREKGLKLHIQKESVQHAEEEVKAVDKPRRPAAHASVLEDSNDESRSSRSMNRSMRSHKSGISLFKNSQSLNVKKFEEMNRPSKIKDDVNNQMTALKTQEAIIRLYQQAQMQQKQCLHDKIIQRLERLEQKNPGSQQEKLQRLKKDHVQGHGHGHSHPGSAEASEHCPGHEAAQAAALSREHQLQEEVQQMPMETQGSYLRTQTTSSRGPITSQPHMTFTGADTNYANNFQNNGQDLVAGANANQTADNFFDPPPRRTQNVDEVSVDARSVATGITKMPLIQDHYSNI